MKPSAHIFGGLVKYSAAMSTMIRTPMVYVVRQERISIMYDLPSMTRNLTMSQ
jgi:hypothetical protein